MILHTVDQAAAIQGVTVDTIERWIKTGDLPVRSTRDLPDTIRALLPPQAARIRLITDDDLIAAATAAANRRGGTGRFGQRTTPSPTRSHT